MTIERDATAPMSAEEESAARRVYLALLTFLQVIMAVEVALLAVEGRWMHVFLVVAVMIAMLVTGLRRNRRVNLIPSEIKILIVLFVFATLFLGEVRDYYERVWWWDLALHASAGLLLGLLGFLIVYIFNEDEAVDLHMRPSFVALFAFFFSVTVGALWEIFEFAMDQFFGLNMQKPMLNDPSGLTDTMWDLILDTLGAGLVSLSGWRYMSRRHRDYIDSWARKFIARNPQLFEPRRGNKEPR